MAIGRKPAKDFAAVYPGWPDIDPDKVSDPNDRRLLIFTHRFNAAYAEFKDRGWITSLRDLAHRIDTGHATILRSLNGERWPMAETVSKLETLMERELWPRQPEAKPGEKPGGLK